MEGIPRNMLRKFRVTPGCWIWTAGINTDGYGQYWYEGKMRKAHRAMYGFVFGNVPSRLLVRHKCDNRRCVNPEHLELGTHQDNSDDCVNRGRIALGERSSNCKLKAEEVTQIRDLVSCRLFSIREISEFFSISTKTVYKIINGVTWSHHG